MITKEIKQSFPPFTTLFVYRLRVSVFFAVYLPRALVVNVNDEMFGSTLSNHSQKIKPNTVYILSMMLYSHK